ncbi:hypothetical protein SAMN02745221_00364 [Thermosyntropha lipolytica DSM 11003]|uniref:CAAX prenyl protease 2/Lysostaphin resistance protein A-like domain-containing protein n=1 Tax=Thermosyntropha lipolytica DSM 11003 TaxID=1123382 RepID=A0A1M5KHK1_9FIRM|nr:type II CAAX endopeptidase family protein [Thermosyntropha lipolytica]SHG51663.1 hypothetical protein SAMN02745221_00364 [Thermosyntropha lipolytica DSM 11003]
MNFFDKRINWGLTDVILIYLGIVVAGVLFSTFSPDIITFMYFKGIEPSEINLFLVSYLLQFLITVLLVFLFVLLIRGNKWKDLGINPVSWPLFVQYGLGGGLFLIIFILLSSIPINYLNPDLSPQLYEEILRSVQNKYQLGLLFLSGALLAPLSEELFYRGMIYPVLRRYLGVRGGILLGGVIFGLAHMDLWRALPLSIGGIILCYIYEKTGSLWPSIAAHGIWNGTMALILIWV